MSTLIKQQHHLPIPIFCLFTGFLCQCLLVLLLAKLLSFPPTGNLRKILVRIKPSPTPVTPKTQPPAKTSELPPPPQTPVIPPVKPVQAPVVSPAEKPVEKPVEKAVEKAAPRKEKIRPVPEKTTPRTTLPKNLAKTPVQPALKPTIVRPGPAPDSIENITIEKPANAQVESEIQPTRADSAAPEENRPDENMIYLG
ncbi:MAG: hypothetical protein ACOYXC_04385, partial [Candidatus Rifleibacteriota bacterium]